MVELPSVETGKALSASQPNLPSQVDCQGIHSIVQHAVTSGKTGERLTIIPAESAKRTNPQMTQMILGEHPGLRLDQSAFHIQVEKRITLCPGTVCTQYEEQQKETQWAIYAREPVHHNVLVKIILSYD